MHDNCHSKHTVTIDEVCIYLSGFRVNFFPYCDKDDNWGIQGLVCPEVGCTKREFVSNMDNLALVYLACMPEGPYFRYLLSSVEESGSVKILWDFTVVTDRSIRANRPDLNCTVKGIQPCFLVDFS